MASRRENEQADMPHILREKVGDDICHCDKRICFINVAHKPLLGKAPVCRKLTVDLFVRLARTGWLTMRRDEVLRVRVEEALKARLIFGSKLDCSKSLNRRRWKLHRLHFMRTSTGGVRRVARSTRKCRQTPARGASGTTAMLEGAT